MKRKEFSDELASRANITKGSADFIFTTMLDLMAETLDNGEPLDFHGYFSLSVEDDPAHTKYFAPRKEFIEVPAKRRVFFKPGRRFEF